MMLEAEVAEARDDIMRTRANIAETVAELELRITAPVTAAKEKLNVVRLVRDHPWVSLAAAVGVGALVSSTGADARAAEVARDTAAKAAEKARETALQAADITREMPGRTRDAAQAAARGAGAYVDGLAGTLLLAFIDRLREADSASAAPR